MDAFLYIFERVIITLEPQLKSDIIVKCVFFTLTPLTISWYLLVSLGMREMFCFESHFLVCRSNHTPGVISQSCKSPQHIAATSVELFLIVLQLD